MHKKSYYIINGITVYRLIAAPLLAFLIIFNLPGIFKWLLAASYLTDAIDGYLARKYKVTSIAGAKLDSVADYFTIIVSIAGIIVFKPEFLKQELTLIISLVSLFIIQTLIGLIRYGRLTSFHTNAAKASAILFVIFLLTLFFFTDQYSLLFYITASVLVAELIEEIILCFLLKKWEADVKGLYWVIMKKNNSKKSNKYLF